MRNLVAGLVGVMLALVLLWPAPGIAETRAAAPARPAASAGGNVIQEVRVEGTNRIEVESVLSYMLIKPGDPFDPARMDASLKALFATGLFSDVTLRREGDTLVVRVVENPVINRLAFEGNKKLKTEDLQNEVELKPRTVYTRTKVQNDVKRILEIYRATGRFAATVTPKVIPLPQNRVDLVYEINEGDVTAVRRISFIGNKVFSDSRLREVVQTEETAWWKFFTTNDTYDPDRLNFDREQLRKFYLSNGYADFRVVSAVAELTPDRKEFFITFTLDEGKRYKFGKVDITSAIPDLDADKLRPELRTKEGDWYNADLVEDTINAVTTAAGNLGYAFVDVRPQVKRDRENSTIDITYEVREGPEGLRRAHRHHRQPAHARRGHPARDAHLRGRCVQRREYPPVAAAPAQPQLLRQRRHHQRAGLGAGQDRAQGGGHRKGDRRSLARRRLLDQRRRARHVRLARAQFPRPRPGRAVQLHDFAEVAEHRPALHRALSLRPQSERRLGRVPRQARLHRRERLSGAADGRAAARRLRDHRRSDPGLALHHPDQHDRQPERRRLGRSSSRKRARPRPRRSARR